jgi:A/G-specific adenine glycosylase
MDVAALLRWYDRGHRDLPWRRTRDPYALLVSEVMLQQTQVARVVPYYERFLARFPDVQSLAAASAADVLREWSGLGYNRRALALKAAAAHAAAHGWPQDAAGLRALPGVGPYTAAAVASFAYGEPVAAVDTNVRRVLERHDGVQRTPAALAARAGELVPRRRAAAFNQAMMELGATVCGPRRPDCGGCPVARDCAGGDARPPARAPAPRARFEETDRWLRGRVVAAALEQRALPEADSARLERIVDGLVRDGLVARAPGGGVRAP